MKVSLTINGAERTHDVEPRLLLVNYIRDVVGLTGTHVGCDTSQCGACTVLMNGLAVKACTILAVQAGGAEILTIEGLAKGDKLHPVQEAFLAEGAFQCGYCTAGMILGIVALLNERPAAAETDILTRMQKHLCRCCSYPDIVKAARRAVAASKK